VHEQRIEVAAILSAPFAENTYIAHLSGRRDCLIVDPGLEPGKICAYVEEHGLEPVAILNTHGHADHIAGNAEMKRRWPDCPLVIGRGDAPMLQNAELNLSAVFGLPLVSPAADVLVDEGNVYEAAGFALEVYEIPGHSPGHVVFVWKGGSPWIVFGGDVLFDGGIGRFDFPGGSFEQLVAGIRGTLFTFPDDTIVLPGHGAATTIGREKRHNPYVGEGAD
jgi:hydroxyacylglutathione hydrolase